MQSVKYKFKIPTKIIHKYQFFITEKLVLFFLSSKGEKTKEDRIRIPW